MRAHPFDFHFNARAWLLGAAALVLAGCGRGADWREAQPDPQAEAPASGYARPPLIATATRAADGGVALSGQGEPNVRLRLASPDGGAYGATANDHGRWSIALPASAGVRLFGLSEEIGGRVIQGEGYIAVLPTPGRAGVLLRAGGGAAPLETSATLQIVAVDFDAAGGAVVSGAAKPGAALRALVDGAAVGEIHAGQHGRYSLALTAAIKPGDHQLQIQTPGGVAQAQVNISPPPQPAAGLPYRGQRVDGGWRIDWLTPGGGPQTTLVLDPAGGRP